VIGKTIAEVTRGDHAEIVRTVQDQDIADFIEAVGDVNPLHSDVAYAATTPFKEPIAPGLFTAGLISAVIGAMLPRPGAIYLSQSLKFVKPVKAGTPSPRASRCSRSSTIVTASGSGRPARTSGGRTSCQAMRG